MENITLLKIIKVLPHFACITIFILTLSTFFGRYPYLELATHFRLQYVWLSVICLVFLLFFNNWTLAVLAFISILLNTIYIIPYYYPTNRQVKNVATFNLKVMTANVEYRNKNYDKLLQSVKLSNPDVLVLQEFTEEWLENTQVLKTDYLYFKTVPKTRGSGLAIFSRYPIENPEILQFDESNRAALMCKINIDGTLLSFLTIHPSTPMAMNKFVSRNKHFAESAKILKNAPEPKLFIGDLNTTMWSPYFSDLVKDSGLRDVRIGNGLQTSWISFLPPPFRIAIDHCLISETIEVESVELGNVTGSDHLPLIVNLKIEKLN